MNKFNVVLCEKEFDTIGKIIHLALKSEGINMLDEIINLKNVLVNREKVELDKV